MNSRVKLDKVQEVVVAVPLGISDARRRCLGQVILGVVGIALFIYSLLPIVHNTYTGLTTIPIQLLESAEALGLPARDRLRLVEAPLAAVSILGGIKTAAVINIDAATLGALIGAGGYGQPILSGIRLDDAGLILEGAVPAAALAVLV
jgi:osmoprotectant transport system permease protein